MLAFSFLSVLAALLSASATASPFALSDSDLLRAVSKPRDEYKGHGQAAIDNVLNEMLLGNSALKTRECDRFSLDELHKVLSVLVAARHGELQGLYSDNADPRELPDAFADVESLAKTVEADAEAIAHSAALEGTVRSTRCRLAVLIFVHHLSEATQAEVGQLVSLPLLPGVEAAPPRRLGSVTGLDEDRNGVHARMLQISGCGACHWTPPKKSKMLGGIGPADLCKGSPQGCPIWPREFSAPFTLHATIPPIAAAKSTFYYKYLENGTQAQVVDYYEKCFPFTSTGNFFNDKPCKLYFDQSGIHLSQPSKNINCCLFKADVGAVPPEFLRSYELKAVNETAPDMYGNDVLCERWEGPDGFKYWTVGDYDETYKGRGHDIVFQDGPTGVTWRWGKFDVRPQSDDIFALPGTPEECAKPC